MISLLYRKSWKSEKEPFTEISYPRKEWTGKLQFNFVNSKNGAGKFSDGWMPRVIYWNRYFRSIRTTFEVKQFEIVFMNFAESSLIFGQRCIYFCTCYKLCQSIFKTKVISFSYHTDVKGKVPWTWFLQLKEGKCFLKENINDFKRIKIKIAKDVSIQTCFCRSLTDEPQMAINRLKISSANSCTKVSSLVNKSCYHPVQ